jgi:hypothetical protein
MPARSRRARTHVEHHDSAVGHAARDAHDDRLRRPSPDPVQAPDRPADDDHPPAAHAPRGGNARVAERRPDKRSNEDGLPSAAIRFAVDQGVSRDGAQRARGQLDGMLRGIRRAQQGERVTPFRHDAAPPWVFCFASARQSNYAAARGGGADALGREPGGSLSAPPGRTWCRSWCRLTVGCDRNLSKRIEAASRRRSARAREKRAQSSIFCGGWMGLLVSGSQVRSLRGPLRNPSSSARLPWRGHALGSQGCVPGVHRIGFPPFAIPGLDRSC